MQAMIRNPVHRRTLWSGRALLLMTVLSAPTLAETPDPPVPLFSSSEALELTIRAPWRELRREDAE